MCQQEAVVTVVQLADAAAEEPKGETAGKKEGEGGQLPWEAARGCSQTVQPVQWGDSKGRE
jgi:hypothetical protein